MDMASDPDRLLRRECRPSSSPARLRRNKWRMIRCKLKLCIATALVQSQPPASTRLVSAAPDCHLPTGSPASDVLAEALRTFMQHSDLRVATCWKSFGAGAALPSSQRVRDLFPIPPLSVWPCSVHTGDVSLGSCLEVANMCLAALNSLEQGFKTGAMNAFPLRPSAAQQSAQHHVAGRVVRFLARLNSVLDPDFSWSGSFSGSEQAGHNSGEAIRADEVDLPPRAGTCKPLGLISENLAANISNVASVFPGGAMNHSTPTVSSAQRHEYVRLTVRELQCGKVRLRRQVQAVASVLQLESPTVAEGETVYFSKRDAATFFDSTLATCVQAGICETSILSPDHDPPSSQDELVFVATDDTVLFHRDARRGEQTLQRLDAAFEENGIPRNREKDVTLAPKITALGCELSNAPAVAEPAAGRLGQAVQRTLDMLHSGVASPRGLHALLGVWEWFSLLQRSFFSIYSGSYSFVQQQPESESVTVPDIVLNEFLATFLLAPLLSAGLDRVPLDMLIATDASPEFGFGVCTCPCSPAVAASVCRMAERRGDFVRLTTCPGDPVELRRTGNPRRLRLKQSDFRTVIRSRARWSAHSGVLEMHGYLLGLKWAARSPNRHQGKLPFLVDAKAVVGAAGKGRSSARAFLTVLRSAAAYTLAANFLPRIVYIPSESNPADAPSRGMHRRRSATWMDADQRGKRSAHHI
eukprot:s3415_g3.t2